MKIFVWNNTDIGRGYYGGGAMFALGESADEARARLWVKAEENPKLVFGVTSLDAREYQRSTIREILTNDLLSSPEEVDCGFFQND